MTGSELRALRELCGWSQREMARRLGVHHNTVWRYEKGRPIPNPTVIAVLKRVSEVLPNVRPEDWQDKPDR